MSKYIYGDKEDYVSKAYLEQEIENQAMTGNDEYWRGWNNALCKVVELIEDAPSEDAFRVI